MALFRVYVTQFRTIDDPNQQRANDATLIAVYGDSLPGRVFWQSIRETGLRSADPEFFDHVDGLLSQPEPSPRT